MPAASSFMTAGRQPTHGADADRCPTQDLYRRLPLRPGALRMHHRPRHGHRLQLLDLHQEGPAFHVPAAEELSAARRRGQSAGISLQQARDPHQSCIDCGVEVFARGSKPDGTEVVALNVSCIDGIELAKLTMTPIDGGTGDRYAVIPGRAEARTRNSRIPVLVADGPSRNDGLKHPAPCSAGKCPPR